MYTKWFKDCFFVFLIMILLLISGVKVYADSRATGGHVSLNKNQAVLLYIDNAKGKYNYGSAKPNNSVSSNAYVVFDVYDKALNKKLGSSTISTLTTSYYKHSGKVEVTYAANLKYKLTMKNSSFDGNMQATNQDFSDIVWN